VAPQSAPPDGTKIRPAVRAGYQFVFLVVHRRQLKWTFLIPHLKKGHSTLTDFQSSFVQIAFFRRLLPGCFSCRQDHGKKSDTKEAFWLDCSFALPARCCFFQPRVPEYMDSFWLGPIRHVIRAIFF